MVRDLGVTNEFLAANVASATKIQQVPSDRFISRGLANTSTGNVQGEQPWYDVQVPDWTTGAHITNSSTLQRYLSSVAETNSLVPASDGFVERFGTFPGSAGFFGGVLAPNGKIYCVPHGTTYCAVIDPINNSVSSIGNGLFPMVNPALGSYAGGVLAANGKIYLVPSNQTTMRVIDPSSNTVSSINNIKTAYDSGVYHPNGKIYMSPWSTATQFLIVDTFNNDSISYTSNIPVRNGRTGTSVAPNGFIYSNGSTIISKIDPSNDTVTNIISITQGGMSDTLVLAPNGKFYNYNYARTCITVLDPSNDTLITFQTPDPSILSDGYVLAPNGKIYFVPNRGLHNQTVMTFIDPNNNTLGTCVNLSNLTLGTEAYEGGIVAPNGKMYFIPFAATSVLCFNFLNNNNWNINICTNPMFNKGI